ncbi:MAG TPA: dihydrodipicolinate synthase family protein [Bryobacteraceae bacterium]|nr:dihydrodipicolinate synthase family protein [Bryobacteraceae bacterium]
MVHSVTKPTSRRDFLALAAATTGSALFPRTASGASGEPRLEGIFPIMQTPFTDSGALDLETLAREVQFLHRVGVQGMTWPQMASEWPQLTFDERLAGAEAIMRANKAVDRATRPAVVIGVQANDIETAVKYARHAEKLSPDAIIAIPLNQGKDEAKQMEYYSAIGEACSRPLIVQTVGQMSVDLVLRMAKQIPTLRYAKDEAGATLPRLTEYAKRGQILRGVFSGKHGPTFLDELARGAVGNMPAAGFADLYVASWKAWMAGQREEAMEVFSKTLLLIMDAQAYGVEGQKYILQLRGVFPNTKCRRPETESQVLDDQAREAIRRTVNYTKRWFKA